MPPAREAPTRPRDVDVSIVVFDQDETTLAALLASLGAAHARPLRKHLYIQDNGSREAFAALRPAGGAFETVSVERSPRNLGFGAAHNANAARARSEFFLVLNPDCELEAGVLDELLDVAQSSPPDVAAWELRQLPYEHPKAYDPASLETRWVSGAATLFRRRAFDEAGGFDPRIFLYAEDVDLSWRLRARGWRLTYQPRLAVTHRTYRHAGEVKPLQVTEGVLSNLCLRARHGGPLETLRGLARAAREIAGPRSFRGRRRGIARAVLRFAGLWPHFARTRCANPPALGHRFVGWDFEAHREGAFHAMTGSRERRSRARPLVSILIRTTGRPQLLRQALASCAHQTYRDLEVIVVEDGPALSREVAQSFADRLQLVYRATGERRGRAAAGNLALATARGEWLNFLDDDDLFFADHVEVLLDAALASGCPAAYGLAWEARTRTVDAALGVYEEVSVRTRHHEPFDRLALWHHNYLPVQSVLFHRRLYERHGGFAEDMEQLEDWNLWTRYSLEDDFAMVAKTTSKYRVPDDPREEAERHARLELAYVDAVARQAHMRCPLSPRRISEMAAQFARRRRLLARIEARFPRAGRALRRVRALD